MHLSSQTASAIFISFSLGHMLLFFPLDVSLSLSLSFPNLSLYHSISLYPIYLLLYLLCFAQSLSLYPSFLNLSPAFPFCVSPSLHPSLSVCVCVCVFVFICVCVGVCVCVCLTVGQRRTETESSNEIQREQGNTIRGCCLTGSERVRKYVCMATVVMENDIRI